MRYGPFLLVLIFCWLPFQGIRAAAVPEKEIHLEFQIHEPYFIAHLLVTTFERRFATGDNMKDLQGFFAEMEERAGPELEELLRGFYPVCRKTCPLMDGM